ncbi:ArnT family glycosyltransferase [Mucilaginibacter sp. E4BP6]|uniref:ArnT family glycosyltransferase n=1 Tax=Mucilaginibacter sp. E4BP6 TaxID=2723089 RepID=UPI0015C95ECD|nr:glycosyltransferase family 39 protein [Mucilaginibacter sp. E4BP6]NYE67312.1 4-amino-4-deoxy-L-arabinose transferase-like glycosyltransferase [Mucilaginibacter sp. E4BP6]
MKVQNKLFYILLFVLALIVNFSGINVKFFTDDPGLYASIAKNLIYKKDYLQLFTYNQDWLDKPHFPFWMVLCSFKLFGISEWAYRLPALLFFMLSALYTWLFSKRYYGAEVAAMAVLILMTSLSIIMSNTDVRAEPYLMAFVIGSIYHVSRLHERYKLSDLILAALLTACALMTKGLFVMVAIYGGLLGQVSFERRFKSLFSWKWLFLALLIIVFIMPECYALYIQFDAHPEKIVFGRQHVSGIRWFLWDSQFGRFVNNGPITRKSADVFFFVHTLLWAFAPWCLMFYYAVFKSLKSIYQKQKLTEYYTLSGGLLLLLLFSVSKFQLPFYTNTIFPLFAVITAPYCFKQLSSAGSAFRLVGQWVYIVAFPVLVLIINYFSKPDQELWFYVDVLIAILVIAFICYKIKVNHIKVFLLNCTVVLFVNFYLNTVFYEQITAYKGQITAADYLNQPKFDHLHIYSLRTENNIFQFYNHKHVDFIPLGDFQNFKPVDSAVFYVNQPSMDILVQSHAQFKILQTFTDYPQENILPKFVNRATREQVLGKVYLIEKQGD